MDTFLGIIPARYASTRFPGKPLADIKGKSMIKRVYEKVSEAIEHLVVATDDQRIFDHVNHFGGKVVMTSVLHQSGTDRCFEALGIFESETNAKFDVVINIQGDEPFIHKGQIELLKGCFRDPKVQIATLIKEISDTATIFNENKPKVVINNRGEALYFSRSPIPFSRGRQTEDWLGEHTFYQHIGLYAYRTKVLTEITTLKTGKLEKTESLEQLRWLENGYKIQTTLTEYDAICIDTPEDLTKALKMNFMD